jgi:hypothetical protein
MPLPAKIESLERIVLTLWVGGLWVTGLVFAPVLFHSYERVVAGDIAGRLFSAMAIVSLGCGTLLLVMAVERNGRGVWRDWRAVVLLGMLILTVIGEFGLAPRMRELKEFAAHHPPATDVWLEFGRLHGVASTLFLINSLLGLVLVVLGIRPRPDQAGS